MQKCINGNFEEIHHDMIEPVYIESEMWGSNIPTSGECSDCDIDRCFYKIHIDELGSQVITGCDKLLMQKALKNIKPSKAIAAEGLPYNEERQRLLKQLFEK